MVWSLGLKVMKTSTMNRWCSNNLAALGIVVLIAACSPLANSQKGISEKDQAISKTSLPLINKQVNQLKDNTSSTSSLVPVPVTTPAQNPNSNEGGDRLPLTADPSSPGSCSLAPSFEMCRDCCNDDFAENADEWSLCDSACSKAYNARHEK